MFESVDGTHSWLAGHASRNYDDISTLKGLCKTLIWGKVAFDLGRRCDVREVGRDTGCIDDIKEAKLVDVSRSACVRCQVARRASHLGNSGVSFEEKGQRLADST